MGAYQIQVRSRSASIFLFSFNSSTSPCLPFSRQTRKKTSKPEVVMQHPNDPTDFSKESDTVGGAKNIGSLLGPTLNPTEKGQRAVVCCSPHCYRHSHQRSVSKLFRSESRTGTPLNRPHHRYGACNCKTCERSTAFVANASKMDLENHFFVVSRIEVVEYGS